MKRCCYEKRYYHGKTGYDLPEFDKAAQIIWNSRIFFAPYGIGEHQIHGSFFKRVYDKSRNQDSCKYDMNQVRKKIDGNSQHAFSAALYGGDRFQCLRFSAEGSHRNVMQYQRPG